MNVGVVGIGYWGSKVIEEYLKLQNIGRIESVIACDKDPAKLKNLNSTRKHTSLKKTLEVADAIHVCTAIPTHYDIASEAIKKDLDVLVEKPLTDKAKTAFDLVELSSETGRILQTGHIFRFANVVREAKKFIQSGNLGEINTIKFSWSHYINPINNTNVFWDLAPHPIDILNFITGYWPEEQSISVTTDSFRSNQIEMAYISFFAGDILVSIHVSWIDHFKHRDLEIVGSKATALIDCVNQTMTVKSKDTENSIAIDKNNTIKKEIVNFIDAASTRKNEYNSAIVGARTTSSIEKIIDKVK
jgi:predicted dehydrogenase